MWRLLIPWCAILALLAGCGRSDKAAAEQNDTQLKVIDDVVGRGDAAAYGDTLIVFYVGKLKDGKVFESSYETNTPAQVVVGSDQILPGWSQGLLGMKVGGKRRVIIPPELGFGDKGSAAGPHHVPPNATLYFEFQLLGLHPAKG